MVSILKGVVFLFIWALWWNWTSTTQKQNSFIAACLFAVIEFSYTSLVYGIKKGYTTFAQFWVLAFYFPFIVEPYRLLVAVWETDLMNFISRVILFPILIWTLEVFEGYLLIFIHGRNTAWEYEPTKPVIQSTDNQNLFSKIASGLWSGEDVFFHGNIKLGHYKLWWLLGIIQELVYLGTEYL